MDTNDPTRRPFDPIDEAFEAGPIPPLPTPSSGMPEGPVIELNPPEEKREVPIGPAIPESAHTRPASPLSDAARELQLEAEEQEKGNQFLP